MINKNSEIVEKYIKEFKIQSCRDLDSADYLLAGNNPHLENVAFLLEQSYEKILKRAYVRYRVEIEETDFTDIQKDMHSHTLKFMFEMLICLHKACGERFQSLFPTIKTIFKDHEKLCKYLDNVSQKVDSIIDHISNKVKHIEKTTVTNMKNKSEFASYISKLNKTTIKDVYFENSYFLKVVHYLRNQGKKNLTDMEKYILSKINEDRWEQYAKFLDLIRELSQYTVPHAVLSRYPDENCKAINLEAYRNNKQLKEFFEKLSSKIRELINYEDAFIEQIKHTFSLVSSCNKI